MIIEYDVVCFERTLQIHFSEGQDIDKNKILKSLDQHYDEWQNSDSCECLEEYMVEETCYDHGLTFERWDSVPYGQDYEPREHLWVCDHCLVAIWSREGDQATHTHYVDEHDAVESKCDWCNEIGFSTLCELI